MVEIGGRPIIWHIMKHYSFFGFNEFVVCLGYKGEYIKDFFLNYCVLRGSLTIDLRTGKRHKHDESDIEPWTVHLLETGADTMTGGRIRRAAQFLGQRRFMATYGDGVSDVDIGKLLSFHVRLERKATITAVRPPARFGGLTIEGTAISEFTEKPQIGEGWINGGFMVIEPDVIDLIDGDSSILERYPLETLARQGQLTAFEHRGFWQCVDTIRDLDLLRELWNSDSAPWKFWK